MKMEGLGNDFVVIEGCVPDPAQVRAWCDRRRGIGADGVLVISVPGRSGAAARMSLWNSDGSVAESCGNGLRCVARYVFDRGWADGRAFTVETPAGHSQVEVMADGSVRHHLHLAVAGGRLHGERTAIRPSPIEHVARHAPEPVAAGLGDRAVRVPKAHPCGCAGATGNGDHQNPVSSDAAAPVAPGPHLSGVGNAAFDHDEVVAQPLHLQELQEVISSITRPAVAWRTAGSGSQASHLILGSRPK